MYNLPYFTEQDPQKVLAFMKANYFVVITGMGDDYPVATHIPVEITEQEDGSILLTGHLMKGTDHHKIFGKNDKVLVIFNGPHTYVSASWYTNPLSGSTWNYMTVHARGTIRFGDETATFNAVKKITEQHEGFDSPASFDKLPDEYVSKLVKAIVAFTITIESYENVFKLSQNHDLETRKNIIRQLSMQPGEGAKLIAKEITDRLES